MALKAKAPELIVPKKPKILLSGLSGSGKTSFAIQFPSLYMVDAEGGSENNQYKRALIKNSGVYMGQNDGSQDFVNVIEEVKSLTKETHPYKALAIDSVSYLFMLEASEAEEKYGSDYGKDKKEANKPSRQLLRYLEHLDMIVLLIAHSKIQYERKGKEIINAGTTFDFFDKTDYLLDLWLEVYKAPTPLNVWKDGKLIVRKSRIESMPQGLIFDMNYNKFSELFGKEIIERPTVPVQLASTEQLDQLKKLMEVLNISDDARAKVLKGFKAESFDELTSEQILGCIESLNKKILSLQMVK